MTLINMLAYTYIFSVVWVVVIDTLNFIKYLKPHQKQD